MTTLTLVDVVELQTTGDGSITWSSSDARSAANLDDYASVVHRADAGEGIIYAGATEERIDGRSDPHARRIREDRRRLTLPAADLEDAWEVTVEDAAGMLIAIYGAEGSLAFRPVADLDPVEVPADVQEI